MQTTVDLRAWAGRTDPEEGEAGRRWHELVRPWSEQSDGIAVVGFACDAGVARNQGRVGACHGPAALRRTLGSLPARRCRSIVDAGDIVCHDGELESAQAALSAAVHRLLDAGLFPVALGGGHEIAFGTWGGLAAHLADRQVRPRIGIVNLDAHLDLRIDHLASSGTPFRQIAESCAARGWPFRYCCLGASEYANTPALFARAQALGATWMRDAEMDVTRLDDVLAVVDHFLRDVDHVYLTICLDVLPAAVAPGVSAPAAHGVALPVVEAVTQRIAASGKLRVADVAELNPQYDIDDHTARVAARLVGGLCETLVETMDRHAEAFA